MYCKQCGRQLSDNSSFCPSCGKALTLPNAAPPAAARPSIQTAVLTGEKANSLKKWLILALAAVIVVIAFFAIRGIVNAANTELANGNYTGAMLRVGNTTYFVSDDYDRKVIRILKIDDKDESKALEVYRVSYPKDGYASIGLLYIKNGTLYFVEGSYVYSGDQGHYYSELKSLNLKREGASPSVVKLQLKSRTSIPESFVRAYADNYDENFSLERILRNISWVENEFVYSVFADGKLYNKALIFKINCTNGKIECIEGGTLGLKESWLVYRIQGGFIYYELYSSGNGYVGLYRAALSDLKEKLLVDTHDGSDLYSVKVINNSLYYILRDSPSGSSYNLHRLDLASNNDTLVFRSQSFIYFNVVGTSIYYFDRGDLRRCNLDGSNDILLIRSGGSSINTTPYISGKWIFYYYDTGWYRVMPTSENFPTRSLD